MKTIKTIVIKAFNSVHAKELKCQYRIKEIRNNILWHLRRIEHESK